MRLSASLRIQIAQFTKQFLGSNQQMRASPAFPSGQTQLAEQQFAIVELVVGSHETIVGHAIAIVAVAAIVIRFFGRMNGTSGATVGQLRANEFVFVRFLIQNYRYCLCLQMGTERR